MGTLIDALQSDGAGARKTPGDIADAVGESGATVKPHPTKTGEGATIHWTDGGKTDVRVENHPVKPGAPPQLHGNVETWDKAGNRIENKHILP